MALPLTDNEWKARIQSAWDAVTIDLCVRLIHEIPARLREMASNGGAKTHPSWRYRMWEHRCMCDVCKVSRAEIQDDTNDDNGMLQVEVDDEDDDI